MRGPNYDERAPLNRIAIELSERAGFHDKPRSRVVRLAHPPLPEPDPEASVDQTVHEPRTRQAAAIDALSGPRRAVLYWG